MGNSSSSNSIPLSMDEIIASLHKPYGKRTLQTLQSVANNNSVSIPTTREQMLMLIGLLIDIINEASLEYVALACYILERMSTSADCIEAMLAANIVSSFHCIAKKFPPPPPQCMLAVCDIIVNMKNPEVDIELLDAADIDVIYETLFLCCESAHTIVKLKAISAIESIILSTAVEDLQESRNGMHHKVIPHLVNILSLPDTDEDIIRVILQILSKIIELTRLEWCIDRNGTVISIIQVCAQFIASYERREEVIATSVLVLVKMISRQSEFRWMVARDKRLLKSCAAVLRIVNISSATRRNICAIFHNVAIDYRVAKYLNRIVGELQLMSALISALQSEQMWDAQRDIWITLCGYCFSADNAEVLVKNQMHDIILRCITNNIYSQSTNSAANLSANTDVASGNNRLYVDMWQPYGTEIWSLVLLSRLSHYSQFNYLLRSHSMLQILMKLFQVNDSVIQLLVSTTLVNLYGKREDGEVAELLMKHPVVWNSIITTLLMKVSKADETHFHHSINASITPSVSATANSNGEVENASLSTQVSVESTNTLLSLSGNSWKRLDPYIAYRESLLLHSILVLCQNWVFAPDLGKNVYLLQSLDGILQRFVLYCIETQDKHLASVVTGPTSEGYNAAVHATLSGMTSNTTGNNSSAVTSTTEMTSAYTGAYQYWQDHKCLDMTVQCLFHLYLHYNNDDTDSARNTSMSAAVTVIWMNIQKNLREILLRTHCLEREEMLGIPDVGLASLEKRLSASKFGLVPPPTTDGSITATPQNKPLRERTHSGSSTHTNATVTSTNSGNSQSKQQKPNLVTSLDTEKRLITPTILENVLWLYAILVSHHPQDCYWSKSPNIEVVDNQLRNAANNHTNNNSSNSTELTPAETKLQRHRHIFLKSIDYVGIADTATGALSPSAQQRSSGSVNLTGSNGIKAMLVKQVDIYIKSLGYFTSSVQDILRVPSPFAHAAAIEPSHSISIHSLLHTLVQQIKKSGYVVQFISSDYKDYPLNKVIGNIARVLCDQGEVKILNLMISRTHHPKCINKEAWVTFHQDLYTNMILLGVHPMLRDPNNSSNANGAVGNTGSIWKSIANNTTSISVSLLNKITTLPPGISASREYPENNQNNVNLNSKNLWFSLCSMEDFQQLKPILHTLLSVQPTNKLVANTPLFTTHSNSNNSSTGTGTHGHSNDNNVNLSHMSSYLSQPLASSSSNEYLNSDDEAHSITVGGSHTNLTLPSKYQQAYDILMLDAAATNKEALLKMLQDDLGVLTSTDLSYCDQEQIAKLGALLKPVQKNKFMKLLE